MAASDRPNIIRSEITLMTTWIPSDAGCRWCGSMSPTCSSPRTDHPLVLLLRHPLQRRLRRELRRLGGTAAIQLPTAAS